jgi:hypothetical protein
MNTNIASANTSISNVTEPPPFFPPTPRDMNKPKCKSPPTTVKFPISCLKCYENSDELVKVDAESKTVLCKSCLHVSDASEYDLADFMKACLYDRKESSVNAFKKHTETAYLSCLADIKRQDNEKVMLAIREREMNLQVQEQERAGAEKNARLELDLKLGAQQFSSQEQMIKMQIDATTAMHQMVTSILPKKSPLEKYKEQKASIATLLSAGDITSEVANQLFEKNNDLFTSSLM